MDRLPTVPYGIGVGTIRLCVTVMYGRLMITVIEVCSSFAVPIIPLVKSFLFRKSQVEITTSSSRTKYPHAEYRSLVEPHGYRLQQPVDLVVLDVWNKAYRRKNATNMYSLKQ